MYRIISVCLAVLLALLDESLLISAQTSAQTFPSSQVGTSAAELRIEGDIPKPLILSGSDLKSMPRKTLSVVNPHEKKQETYEGVPLEEILRKAGVPNGEQLRGAAMTTYIIAQAEDGYRVVFSLAELDSGILNSEVLVADTMDGATIPPKQGPLRLVAPHDKRPARWVRMLKSITIAHVSQP